MQVWQKSDGNMDSICSILQGFYFYFEQENSIVYYLVSH